jgi:hypothetical protein
MNTKTILTLFLIASSIFATAQKQQRKAKLPNEATTFLEANFKGIEIQEAKKELEGTLLRYKVKLVNGSEIEFNNRGRWKALESKTVSLPTSMLQKSVGHYIQKNYSGAKITEIKKGIRFNFLEINNETMLQFDTEGNFYKIMEMSRPE